MGISKLNITELALTQQSNWKNSMVSCQTQPHQKFYVLDKKKQ